MPRYFFLLILAMSSLLLLAGCKDESRSGYVELGGRLFIFNPRMATATYVVTLRVLRPLPEGAKVVAIFEDPAGGESIHVERTILVPANTIALESPSLLCIKKGKRYTFDVNLLSKDGAALQTVSSSIESSLDQSILPDAPLVVGPAYEPNPVLKDHPSGKLPHRPKPKCPA